MSELAHMYRRIRTTTGPKFKHKQTHTHTERQREHPVTYRILYVNYALQEHIDDTICKTR